MDLALLEDDARRRRRARLPRPPGVALGGARRRRLRRDDRPARRAARAAGRDGPVLDARARSARRPPPTARSRRSSTPHDGRPVEAVLMRYRDGRRSVCVSSQSGCPLTCTFCATGQMRFGRNLTRRGDPRPGPALPAHRAARPPRVHGHGRAADEPRRRARRRARGSPTSASPTAARASPPSAGCRASARLTDERRADPPRALAARARGRAALADHAGQRALPARRGARGVRGPLRAPPPAGVRRVRDARRRQRPLRAGGRARRAPRPADLQGQPDPLQPDRLELPRLVARPPSTPSAPRSRSRGLRATVRLTRGRDIDAACGQLAARAATPRPPSPERRRAGG